MRSFAVLLVAAVAAVAVTDALTISIGIGARKCFTEELGSDVLVVGSYSPVASEITALLTSPSGDVLVRESGGSGTGKWAFTTKETGSHQLCFSNTGSSIQSVTFSLKHGVEARDYSEVAKKEHLKPLEAELRRLEDETEELYDDMLYMREREEAMRNTNESTNSRVVWYSMFTIVVLLGLGAAQLYILHNDFKAKKLI